MSRRDFWVHPAVHVAPIRDGEVLLNRRQNTGWFDNCWDVPSEHVERFETPVEAAVRELKEEAGLKAREADLTLFHVATVNAQPGKPYIYFMFKVALWSGEPEITEPDRCSDQAFYPLDELPAKTIPYVVKALGDISTRTVTFSHWGRELLVGQR